jgi:hypothetical protein
MLLRLAELLVDLGIGIAKWVDENEKASEAAWKAANEANAEADALEEAKFGRKSL